MFMILEGKNFMQEVETMCLSAMVKNQKDTS